MARSLLREQVERILDVTSAARLEVIVQAAEDGAEPLATVAAAAVRDWRLCDLPRRVLPGEPTGNHGVAARLAAAGLAPGQPTVGVARASALEAVARAADGVREASGTHEALRAFWAARSLLVHLDRDALAQLPTAAPAVVEVALNRHLPVPPVLEVAEPPSEAGEPTTWGLERIGAPRVWEELGARGDGVRIGLLDTGVDPAHPDLEGKVSAFAEFDGQGNRLPNAQPRDSDRHGTHVAGTLVGGEASGQAVGVAPGATLAVALVLDGAAGGSDAQVLAGFDWVLEEGVDVINLSLGAVTLGPEAPGTYSRAFLTAHRQGVPVVAAVGNEGSGTSGSPGNDLFAFSVGALDERDVVAGFSGGLTLVLVNSDLVDERLLPLPYRKPEVSAPGVAVRSAVTGGGYAHLSGTSMSTPHVAGTCALVLSAVDLSTVPAAERGFLVQDLVAGSAADLGEAGLDHRYGFGRLDAFAAVTAAREWRKED